MTLYSHYSSLVVRVVVKEVAVAVRKALNELLTWSVVASISLGVSASVINYGIIKALEGASNPLINTLLILFGAVWLLISATLMYNILRILRRYGFLHLIKYGGGRLGSNELMKFLKDAISLYRGYRWYIVAIGVTSAVVGLVFAVLTMHAYLIGSLSTNELLFKLAVATTLLFYGILDVYIEERSIGKRLARVKVVEDKLMEFLQ